MGSQEEAVMVLQSMFTSLDKEVMVAVLQAHQGNVELAIDSLLSLTTNQPETQSNSIQFQLKEQHPDTTLNGDVLYSQNQSSNLELDQIKQDELVALQLQNSVSPQTLKPRPNETLEEDQITQDELVALQLQNELFSKDDLPTTPDNDFTMKDIKDKVSKLSEAAKLKCKEFFQRLSSNKENSTNNDAKALDSPPKADNNLASENIDGHKSDGEENSSDNNKNEDNANYAEVESSPKLIDRRKLRQQEKS